MGEWGKGGVGEGGVGEGGSGGSGGAGRAANSGINFFAVICFQKPYLSRTMNWFPFKG